MRAAKHDPEFARKMGISHDVAAEFVAADAKKQGGSYTRKVGDGMEKKVKRKKGGY